jgi:ATP-dependent RNA helicase RhlE
LNHVTPDSAESAVAVLPAALPDVPANDDSAVTFAGFGLAEPIQRALDAAGYETPTPIQAGAIPSLLQGRDMLGIAQTGTGKTAAFALPILNRLASAPHPLTPKATRALILAPTRELVIQIAESFRTYGKHMKLRSCAVFGGVSEMHQIKAMAVGVDVLIATPGRLLDLVQRRHILLSGVQTFVLDEADRMLDMGFIRDINKIVAMIPVERQSLLFSATMPKEIAHLAAKLLRDPVRVEVTPEVVTVDRIEQKVYFVDSNQKRPLLVALLKDPALSRVVVFTRTKHVANRVSDYINAAGITSDAIHGNKSQNARQKALDNFKKGHVRVLVATDIAARGIHVSDVSHVINYELPNIPESYVHRIGRTARAGAEGIALSFCDKSERAFLRDIERFAKTSLTPTEHAFTGAAPQGGEGDRRERGERGHRGGGGDRGRHEQRGREHRGGKPHHGKPHNNKPRHHEHGEAREHRNDHRGENREHRQERHEQRHEHREPQNRAEANLSHAERYFGGGRSPTREGQKRADGFHGHKPQGDKPHGQHRSHKHGGKPHRGRPHGERHGHSGDKPLRRQNRRSA